jgi:ankyrin repeat protein
MKAIALIGRLRRSRSRRVLLLIGLFCLAWLGVWVWRVALGFSLLGASDGGDVASVRRLVSLGASVNFVEPGEGDTPLIKASMLGKVEVATFLLDHGAHMDAGRVTGATALLKAVEYNRPEVVHLLLTRGADPNAGTVHGVTPLYWAASDGRGDLVDMLLRHGATVDAQVTYSGQTPLMAAVIGGHVMTVRMLMASGADCSATDKNGKTALDYAHEHSQSQIARLLQAAIGPKTSQPAMKIERRK